MASLGEPGKQEDGELRNFDGALQRLLKLLEPFPGNGPKIYPALPIARAVEQIQLLFRQGARAILLRRGGVSAEPLEDLVRRIGYANAESIEPLHDLRRLVQTSMAPAFFPAASHAQRAPGKEPPTRGVGGAPQRPGIVPPPATLKEAPLPTTTIFLGSSTLAKSQAKVFMKTFQSATLTFLPWWEAFTPGRTLLEELDAIKGKVDGALLLFSPEITAEVGGNLTRFPNLNVLFEFGYFYGVLGKQKVAMLKYGEFYLPSDLGGYVYIVGSRFFERNKSVKIGNRTSEDFARWIKKL